MLSLTFDEILERDPSRADITAERAVVLRGMGRSRESIEGFSDVLAGEPSAYYSGLARFHLGELSDSAEKLREAIVDLAVATQEAWVNDPDPWLLLGMAQRELWGHDVQNQTLLPQSEANILRATEIDPFYGDAWVELKVTQGVRP